MPECDAAAIKVDFVGDVVPDVGLERGAPLGLGTGVPAERRVGGARSAGDEAVFEFSEVGFAAALNMR